MGVLPSSFFVGKSGFSTADKLKLKNNAQSSGKPGQNVAKMG
jgi:hypothetical protein